MSYTETDLENVKNAILELATGKRVVEVSIGGNSTRYANTDIDALKSLLSEIRAELQSASGRHRFVLTATSKGL